VNTLLRDFLDGTVVARRATHARSRGRRCR
jgi:hypothetical protein